MDLGAQGLGALGVGLGHAGGIDVAAVRLEHDAADAGQVEQRMKLLGLGDGDLVEVDLEVLGLGRLQAELVLAIRRLRHVEGARLEDTAALPCLLLQLGVELHGVVLQLGDVVVVVEPVDAGGGVPGRAGSQLVALQQDGVGPAELRQVIEHAAADQTAADDHRLRLFPHFSDPFPPHHSRGAP